MWECVCNLVLGGQRHEDAEVSLPISWPRGTRRVKGKASLSEEMGAMRGFQVDLRPLNAGMHTAVTHSLVKHAPGRKLEEDSTLTDPRETCSEI